MHDVINPLSTEFHFLEVFLKLLIPCMISISNSPVLKHPSALAVILWISSGNWDKGSCHGLR